MLFLVLRYSFPQSPEPMLLNFKQICEDFPLFAVSSLVLAAHYVFVEHIYSGTKSGYGVFELNNERFAQVEDLRLSNPATTNWPLNSQPPVLKSPPENLIFVILVFSTHSYSFKFLLLYEHARWPYEFCVFLFHCFTGIMAYKSLSSHEEHKNGRRPDVVVRRSEQTALYRRYVDIVQVFLHKKIKLSSVTGKSSKFITQIIQNVGLIQ